jgi:hypothetical protein
MTPADEHRLDRWLRYPEALPEAERAALGRLLRTDPEAAAYASAWEAFFELLREEEARPPHPRLDAFVDRLFEDARQDEREGQPSRRLRLVTAAAIDDAPAEPSLPLRPYRPARRAGAPSVLAAATAPATASATAGPRLRVLTTLVVPADAASDSPASEGYDLLVRLIGDTEAGTGHLYVLTRPREAAAHAVVAFPEMGVRVVTDEGGYGTLALPPGVPPEAWRSALARLYRPQATLTLSPGEAATARLTAAATARVTRSATHVTVRATPPGVLAFATAQTPASSTPTLLDAGGAEEVACACVEDGPARVRLYVTA